MKWNKALKFILVDYLALVRCMWSLLDSSATGCDEISGSGHLLSKVNLDHVFPEESSALLDSTAFTIFNNDSEELTNANISQEDNEQSGHIILVPASKTSVNAAGNCWPR